MSEVKWLLVCSKGCTTWPLVHPRLTTHICCHCQRSDPFFASPLPLPARPHPGPGVPGPGQPGGWRDQHQHGEGCRTGGQATEADHNKDGGDNSCSNRALFGCVWLCVWHLAVIYPPLLAHSTLGTHCHLPHKSWGPSTLIPPTRLRSPLPQVQNIMGLTFTLTIFQGMFNWCVSWPGCGVGAAPHAWGDVLPYPQLFATHAWPTPTPHLPVAA